MEKEEEEDSGWRKKKRKILDGERKEREIVNV